MRTPQETAVHMAGKYGKYTASMHVTQYALNHRFDAIDRGEAIPNDGERYWMEVMECLRQLRS